MGLPAAAVFMIIPFDREALRLSPEAGWSARNRARRALEATGCG